MPRLPRSKRVLIQFASSYVLVALIPLLLFSWLVLFRFVDELTVEIERNLSDPFTRSVELLEREVDELSRMTTVIETNPLLTATDINIHPYQASEIRRELRLVTESQIVGEAFYYNVRHDYVVGYNYIAEPEIFTQLVFQDEDIRGQFLDFLQTSDGRTALFVPANRVQLVDRADQVMVLHRVPFHSRYTLGVVIYFLPVRALVDILETGLVGDSALMVWDAANNTNLVTVTNTEGSSELAERWSQKDSNAVNWSSESGTLVLQDHDLNVRLHQVNGLPWFLLRLSSHDQLAARLKAIRTPYFISVLIISVLLAIVISLVTRSTYRPIKRIRSIIEDMTTNADELHGSLKPVIDDPLEELNEIERMERLLELYSRRHSELKEQVDTSEHIHQNYLLDAYLMGQASLIENIDALTVRSKLVFDQPWYRVIILMRKDHRLLSPDDIESILVQLQNSQKFEITVIPYHDRRSGGYVFIVGGAIADEERMRSITDTICMQLRSLSAHTDYPMLDPQADHLFVLGTGRAVSDSYHLHNSYEDALRVIDRSSWQAKSDYLLYEDLERYPIAEIEYPNAIMSELETGLSQRDRFRVRAAFAQLTEHLSSSAMNPYCSRQILLDVWSAIKRHIHASDSSSILLERSYVQRIFLGKLNQIQDALQVLSDLEADAETWLANREETYELHLLTQIVSYLRQHALDPQFNLESLADSLEMSRPYLSQYFKKHTDLSISDYVTRLRMEAAKQLLVESKKPVQDIAIEVGYYSVSSFIRKFRSETGTTPGQYRTEYQES